MGRAEDRALVDRRRRCAARTHGTTRKAFFRSRKGQANGRGGKARDAQIVQAAEDNKTRVGLGSHSVCRPRPDCRTSFQGARQPQKQQLLIPVEQLDVESSSWSLSSSCCSHCPFVAGILHPFRACGPSLLVVEVVSAASLLSLSPAPTLTPPSTPHQTREQHKLAGFLLLLLLRLAVVRLVFPWFLV